jgi:hypothetical protein
MPNSLKNAARRPFFLGLPHLDRFAGGPRSAMQDFLIFLSKRDVVFEVHDFNQKAINTTHDWTTNAGTGATAFAVPATQLAGGAITGATGTDATESNRCVNLYGSRTLLGDKNCGVLYRLKVGAAATNIEMACGLVDTHTTITTAVPLLSDIDTPAFASGLGDGALVGIDTAETLTTMALATLGSTPYAAQKSALGTFAPTAAQYFTVVVQLNGDNVFGAVDTAGASPIETNISSGIEGGTLVRPMLAISGPTATTKTWDIDLIAFWQER